MKRLEQLRAMGLHLLRPIFLPEGLILLALFCVGTYVGRNSFFYSDDFTVIQEIDWSFLIKGLNGHLIIIPNSLYFVLLNTFGLQSYLPYLIATSLINLAFGLVLLKYLNARISRSASLLVVLLILLTPGSVHTQFWLGSAVFLIPLTSVLILKILENAAPVPNFALVVIAYLNFFMGGYGIPAIVSSIWMCFLFKRQFLEKFLVILLPIPAYYSLSLQSVSTNSAPKPELAERASYVLESMRMILENKFSYPVLAAMLFLAIILFMARPLKLKIINQSLRDSSVWMVFLLTFILLISLARNQVEPITASRYIQIASAALILFVLDSLKCFYFGAQERVRQTSKLVIFILILITLVPNSTYWIRGYRDASYGGEIRRAELALILCVQDQTQSQIKENSDGLQYVNTQSLLNAFKNYGAMDVEIDKIVALQGPGANQVKSLEGKYNLKLKC
jgi:hypothetical protein